jgi:hypothetical protein
MVRCVSPPVAMTKQPPPLHPTEVLVRSVMRDVVCPTACGAEATTRKRSFG